MLQAVSPWALTVTSERQLPSLTPTVAPQSTLLSERLEVALGGAANFSCPVRSVVGATCTGCAYAYVESSVDITLRSASTLTVKSTICTACDSFGARLTETTLDALSPPAVCWQGLRRNVRCMGTELFGVLMDAGRRIERLF